MQVKLFLFSIGLLFAASPHKPPKAHQATLPPDTVVNWTQQVVELTNQERAKHNLPPLKNQPTLHQSALWLSQDMATHGYFSHTDFSGHSIDTRLPGFGYTPFRAIGENIAGGQPTPAAVVAAWMKSPGHRANILNMDFREIGVGVVLQAQSSLKRYWTQDFGTRPDVYPLVINGEAARTPTTNVHLYIYGEGWAARMRLSNDGEHWSNWEPYAPRREWELDEGKGTHTVYVELSNGDSILRSQDTIELVKPTNGSGVETPR